MKNRRCLTVLLSGAFLAGPAAFYGQKVGEPTDTDRMRNGSSRVENVRQNSVQLIEKRPAWAESLIEEAEQETFHAKVPVAVVDNRSCYGVQVGAFRSPENARKLADKLSNKFGAEQTLVKAQSLTSRFHRVVVGCKDEPEAAKLLQEKLARNGTRGIVTKIEPDSPTPATVP